MHTTARGSGGVPIPGGVQKTCRCGTSGCGLAGMVVLGRRLDLMILEVFSNLWFYDSTEGTELMSTSSVMYLVFCSMHGPELFIAYCSKPALNPELLTFSPVFQSAHHNSTQVLDRQ